MYLIDKAQNRIKELEKKTFSELGVKERHHLQRWLALQPSAFGEELLIIQKKFNGFNDTNEQLDLLALDKEESFADLFEQEYEGLSLNRRQSRCFVIVAANFRKEVTSNVLWLLDLKLETTQQKAKRAWCS